MPGLALIVGMAWLTLCCYPAMTRSQTTKVENMETTTWNPTPVSGPRCTKPPAKENAYLQDNENQESYLHAQTVTYTCRPGYVRSRRITMICLDGKWKTLSDGYCKKRSCGHPGDIPFGSFVLRNEEQFVFGAVVRYTCDPGYQMASRKKTRICGADGWINPLPHCEARLCPPVWDNSVEVQTSVTDDEFTMGHVVVFKCRDPRSELRGSSMIVCNQNGKWNMKPPTCKSNGSHKYSKGSCTVQKIDMQKNNIKLKDNKKQRFEDHENVEFECVAKHNISDPASLMIRCHHGILKYPTCNKTVISPCGRPPQIAYGELKSTLLESYKSGSTVQYQCPSMYKLQGPKMIRCQGGTWDHPPVCLEPCTTSEEDLRINHLMILRPQKKIDCVWNSENQKFAQKCYLSHNDTIQFTCVPGYNVSDREELISKCDRGILPYPRCF